MKLQNRGPASAVHRCARARKRAYGFALHRVRDTQLLLRILQPPHHLVELFKGAVADVHGAALAAVVDVDRKPERIGKLLLQRDACRRP